MCKRLARHNVHPVAFRYASSLMRMRIWIRLDVLGSASVGRVVIARGGASTALVDGAVPPASSMMLRMMVVVVVCIMLAPAMRLL